MPRKIEIREFENEGGEFGLSVIIFGHDEKTIIKSRVFSALPNYDHFLVRSYDVKASFLATPENPRYDNIQIEHNLKIVITLLSRRARECLEEFKRDYAFSEE